ncbi:efflux RND transporter periplasmic adaptor subunit [Sinimarinibacterium sp. CAU 1509]|uniref:efflux RND transporter periplasmic adaptor subunit n=1 Tax=Sinimarinibacterium sp. CAU 1509 TaxID=2562283 RepID=UPI00146E6E4F|nr:efflux RND transporter periplasmic adaptor subunit [Sinimarinibacterium sp. CAU 1509]
MNPSIATAFTTPRLMNRISTALPLALLALSLSACSAKPTEAPSVDTTATAPTAAEVIRIAPADYAGNRITIATAGPATLSETLEVYGEITLPRNRKRQLSARYPGIVRSVDVRQGDAVKAGDALLTIESSDSLRTYRLTSPIDGIVLELHAGTGESVSDAVLAVVADLSQVNAALTVFASQAGQVALGQAVEVMQSSAADAPIRSKLTYVGAEADSSNRGVSVRAPLDNVDRHWLPGQFVKARIEIRQHSAALAVPADAVQSIDGKPSVFVETPDGLTPQQVRLGAADSANVEILEGIVAGTRVARGNTFMLKSELLTREEE